MSPLQIAFIVLTFALPPLLVWFGRRSRQASFDHRVCLILGIVLLVLEAIDVLGKHSEGKLTLQYALPMQLCDWALFASAFALLFRSAIAFDLAYFWGLGGTVQALFTPAVGPDLSLWRLAGFFAIHSGIVIAVLYLLISRRFRPRPRSLMHVAIASQIYLGVALLINRYADANYGFLSTKPLTRTMLDLLSDDHVLYLIQLNALAFFLFGVLYAPWFVADLRAGRIKAEAAA